MTQVPTVLELFKAGAHLGHHVSKRHPKMLPFIHSTKNTIHLINLEKTVEQLKAAGDFLSEIIAKGGNVLFVGTKPAAYEAIKKVAMATNMPFVVERWLGGTLTNFTAISNTINKMKRLEKEKDSGEWDTKYTKKERLLKERLLQKLQKTVGGLRNLERLPQVIFIIDIRKESTTLKEAERAKISTVGIVDTNANPNFVDYPIPANDDSTKTINLITNYLSDVVQTALKKRAKA